MVMEDHKEEKKKESLLLDLSDTETRRNVFGRGGFMSPMRRIAEAAHRVHEVQDMTISDSPRDPTDVNIVEQETERWDFMLESNPTIEEGIPSIVERILLGNLEWWKNIYHCQIKDPLLLERNK